MFNHDNDFPQVWMVFATHFKTRGTPLNFSIHSKVTLTKHLMTFRRICHKITLPLLSVQQKFARLWFSGNLFSSPPFSCATHSTFMFIMSCSYRAIKDKGRNALNVHLTFFL